MPGFDRNGPMGAGAMTGGKRGFCDVADRGAENTAYTERYVRGRGCGRGRFLAGGYGRGFGGQQGRAVSPPMQTTSPPDELEYLTQEAQNLERNLQTIKKQIDDLQKKSE